MATGVTGHTGAHAAGRVGAEPRPGHGGATIPRRDQGARTAGVTVKRREDAMNRNVQVGTFACNFALCIEAPPTVHSSFELHTSQDVKKVGSSTGTPATSTSPLGQTGRMPSAGKSTRKQVGMRHCGTEDLNRSKSIWVGIHIAA